MRPVIDRAVFTVARSGAGWALELDGEVLETSTARQDVMASASRRARASQDAGRPSQIRAED